MNCTANKTNGQPCKAPAIKGGTVCRVHGGSAPQVKAKAMQRLLAAVDPIMAELVELALKGETPAVKLAAIRDALDRAGVGEAKRVEVLLTDSVLEEEIARLKAELGEE